MTKFVIYIKLFAAYFPFPGLNPCGGVFEQRPMDQYRTMMKSRLTVVLISRVAAVAVAGLAGPVGAGEDAPADKSVYHLFHPTPFALMRELNTDRPDKTESPFTVDAGHYQIELD